MMNPMTIPSNIVLVGMPGSGKSTVGVLLAKQTRRHFVDTDVLVQMWAGGQSLQGIVDSHGHLELRRMEEEVVIGTRYRKYVIATGGSVIYSSPAMDHLKTDGAIVFLNADVETLASRIRNDFDTRGLSKAKDQTFAQLFDERFPLYEARADLIIECSRLSHDETCTAIIEGLREKGIR
jgi:shikimate kinase